MNGGIEVAIEFASLDHFICVACTVELELIHAILVDHLETSIAKVAVVFRTRQRKSTFVRLKSLCLRRRQPLLLRLVVTTPRREPDSGRCSVFGSHLRYIRQAGRKSWIELPQGRRIIPSIVKHKTVELHPPLFCQVLAKSVDRLQHALLVVAIEISQVVPRVVVQKSSVRVRALLFHVSEKVAPKLPRMGRSQHRRIGHALACSQRQFTRYPARSPETRAHGIRTKDVRSPGTTFLRRRAIPSLVPRPRRPAPAGRPAQSCASALGSLQRANSHFLPKVIRIVMQHCPPRNSKFAGWVLELDTYLLTRDVIRRLR